jgi:hypothetical protein
MAPGRAGLFTLTKEGQPAACRERSRRVRPAIRKGFSVLRVELSSAQSRGAAIVLSPAWSEAECRERLDTRKGSPGGTIGWVTRFHGPCPQLCFSHRLFSPRKLQNGLSAEARAFRPGKKVPRMERASALGLALSNQGNARRINPAGPRRSGLVSPPGSPRGVDITSPAQLDL